MIETGLKDRVVVVTGGAAGIGKATALRFAEEGCRVVVWDLNEQGTDDLMKAIADVGGQGIFVKVNVADSDTVKQAIQVVLDRFGRIDVLVNNAGIVRDSQLVKYKNGELVSMMSDEAWDAVIGVNLRGVFNCTRAVVPHMIETGGGVVLNASSVVGLYGNFGQTNYVATKSGVIGMTRVWARELGKFNIRVNAVAPGFVATEILQCMPEKVIENMVKKTPMGRMGKPRDIADAYLWLASDAATWITGEIMSVDGGIVTGT